MKQHQHTLKKKRVYNATDYQSNDGMLTAVWGPAMWHFLHTFSFNYPIYPSTNEKHHYMSFIKNLIHVLPCKYCRINLKQNFMKKPITLSVMKSRNTFSKYVYELHEIVNTMLHKKSGLTYDEVRDRYEHFRARCLSDSKSPTTTTTPPQPTVSSTASNHKLGCTEPIFGQKSKCIIRIVPINKPIPTFEINKQCIHYKLPTTSSKSLKRR